VLIKFSSVAVTVIATFILTRGQQDTFYVDCSLGPPGRDDHDRGPHARSLSDLQAPEARSPVLRVKSVGRTFLTKAADTKYVKDNAALFSSNDPNTPMKRAFLAHTLMRKDHDEHRTERMAMMVCCSCYGWAC